MLDKDPTDLSQLRHAGVRPTHQRLMVARLLRESELVHFTADDAFRLASEAGMRVSLATIYNALNDFAKAGLLRRIDFGERISFCTNLAHHHHFLDLSTGRLQDIPDPQPLVDRLPPPPAGHGDRWCRCHHSATSQMISQFLAILRSHGNCLK